MFDGPGGTGWNVPVQTRRFQPVPPGPSSIKNDAHGIEKLLLKTQVNLTSFLHSEVNKLIQHIFKKIVRIFKQ